MKICVVGASGPIGTKVVAVLLADGHDVVAASPSSGVDVVTGSGLADAERRGDGTKTVVTDPEARYFGARLSRDSLVTPDAG